MKILQICQKPPYPPSDGGTIAMNNITQGLLKEGYTVKVLTMETQKHPVCWEAMPDNYLKSTELESVFVDTSISLTAAFVSIFSQQSYQVARFFSKPFSVKLTEILQKQKFDIIHLESIFTTPYIPLIRRYSQAKIVLRTHNIEHLIWQRIAKNEPNLLRKLAVKILSRQLQHYEYELGQKVDAVIPISIPDMHFFTAHYQDVPATVIPFGMDIDAYEPEVEYIPSDKPELFHVGSMDWLPNVEGIEWFLNEIWPSILGKFPEITFAIAGRKIPPKIQQRKDPNLTIVGEVPSAKEFMLSKDIMIVPLLSGSGVRVKIIEGMALGKVIITTTIGAEGLSVEDGKNILIADTPDDFVAAIEKCVNTPDLCAIIGENARNFVALNHNNELITKTLIDFYHAIQHGTLSV